MHNTMAFTLQYLRERHDLDCAQNYTLDNWTQDTLDNNWTQECPQPPSPDAPATMSATTPTSASASASASALTPTALTPTALTPTALTPTVQVVVEAGEAPRESTEGVPLPSSKSSSASWTSWLWSRITFGWGV